MPGTGRTARSAVSATSGGPESGASFTEYLALGVLAAIIVVSVAPVVSGTVRTRVESVICTIIHLDAVCGRSRAKQVHVFAWAPSECTRASSSESYGLRVDVSYLSVSAGVTFMKTTTADGRVHMTALDDATANAMAGLGAKWNWGRRINLGPGQESAAGLTASVGDTWDFADDPQARRFESRVRRLSTVEAAKQFPGLALVARGYEKLFPTRLPHPDITRREVGLHGYYTVSDPGNLGNGKSAENSVSLIPQVLLAGGASAETKAVVEHDATTGTNAITYNFTYGGYVGALNYRRTATAHGQMKVTRDAHGRIVDLQVSSDFTKNGAADVTTFDLRPETPAERDTVEHWLTSGDGSVATGTSLKKIFGGVGETDHPPYLSPPPFATPFERMLYQKGRFMHQTYGQTDRGGWNGGGVDRGLAVGAYYLHSGSNRKLRTAEYLGAPDAAGVRRYVPFRTCR